ncbi:MAG: hypothetical protein QGD90_08070 [Candidatus Hydrogenedentes bacterium]|nr:hypothetical protein [Candidatus Hydrogenedentota bacterium]
MDQAIELIKLCEDWCKDTTDAADRDLRGCFEKYLSLLGWEAPKSFESAFLDVSGFVEAPDGISLVVYFTVSDALLPPSKLLGLGLDFCDSTRWRVEEAREHHFDYALITDLYRSYLYDVETDELLLSSDTPSIFLIEIYDEITKECVDEGSLREIRRNPRSTVAKQLRHWRSRWSTSIEQQAGGSDEIAATLIDRLFVLRFLAERELERKGGSGLHNRIRALGDQARSPAPGGTGKELERLFNGLFSARRMALYAPAPELKPILENDDLLAPMLGEFALISKVKFTIPALLESFNFGEAAEKARVRLVPGGDGRREDLIANQTLDAIDDFQLEIDVLEEGYRAIGFWLGKLTALYHRLAREAEAADVPELGPGGRMPRAIRDMHRHSVESGLRIFYNSPRQFRTARLMLYLYTIKAYSDSGEAFAHFPKVELAFKQRPVLLDSEKRWIAQPSAGDTSRGRNVV